MRNRVLAISIQVYDVQRPWGQGIYIEVPSVVSKGSIVLLVDGINTIDNAYALCFVPKVTHLRTKASTGDHSMLSFLGSETSTSILVYVHGFIYFPFFLFVHFFFISFFLFIRATKHNILIQGLVLCKCINKEFPDAVTS